MAVHTSGIKPASNPVNV